MKNELKTNKNAEKQARKTYATPQLTDHGPVSELTQTSSTFSGVGDGGGTFPNFYAS